MLIHYHYRIGGNTYFETMDMEQTYKLRSEKCLISLAKACDLKRFCYNPDSEKDLIPIIVGRNKIQGKHFIFLYFRALICFEFVIITKILGTESMINYIKVTLLGLLAMFISAIEAFKNF